MACFSMIDMRDCMAKTKLMKLVVQQQGNIGDCMAKTKMTKLMVQQQGIIG